MKTPSEESNRERWSRFRFSVIGFLLAAPPGKGELRTELEKLARRVYRHPITGVPTRFGLSTVERWYYQAREARDPVGELKSRARKDAGEHPVSGLYSGSGFARSTENTRVGLIAFITTTFERWWRRSRSLEGCRRTRWSGDG